MRFHDIRRGRRDEARPGRTRRAGTPGIEALEGRVVMATGTSVWSGAVNNLWSISGNWDNPPISGNTLAFPSTGLRTTNTNDLAAGTAFGSVTIGGPGYAITGNQIGLTGSITSTVTSGSDQFDLPVALGADLSVNVANAAATLRLGGVISGAHGLAKSGTGTADLSGANTYTGPTAVAAGTLLIDGDQASSPVGVAAGGTLGGVGTVASIAATGGIVSPGDGGPGILTDAGPLTLSAASTFAAPLNGTTAGTGYSQLDVAGAVNLGGSALSVTLGATPTGNQQYTLIHNTSGTAVTGTFAGLAEGAVVAFGNQPFKISYAGGASGHDVVLTHLVGSATTVSSSSSSPTFGASVTLTAVVTGIGGTGTPGGSVQFFANSTPLGTGTLNGNGVATLNTTALPVGVDQVTAAYAGNASFAPSTSSATTVNVAKAPTTTTLTVIPIASAFGQSVTLTATVAPTTSGLGTPTGTVEFLNGSSEIETIRMTNGVATLTTSALPVGNDSITALYESDNTFASSTSKAVVAAVSAVPTTTTLAVSPTQPSLGQTVDLTATVAPAGTNTGTPTGTVTFLDGASVLGTSSVNSSGVATLATTGLVGGSNALTARYNTDGNFATSTSPVVSVTVPQGTSTTALSISPNPSSFGQSVTLAATVTGLGGGSLLPTGTVQFFAGSTSLGTATLASGIGSLTTTALPIGNTPVAAVYQGSTSFAGSGSPVVVAQVSLAAPTVTVTASIPNPGPTQTEVLTAKVASGLSGNTPTGTVIFFGNGVDLGSATLTNGTGSVTLKGLLPIGTEAITAQYLGDANNASGTSSPLTVPVGTALERYLNAIYLQTLGRPIDNGTGQILTINTGGLSGWLTQFVQGGAQRAPVVNGILHFKETRQFGVQATYVHLAGKQAASPQLQNAFIHSNGATVNLDARVLGGPAYYAAAGSTVAGFLSALGTDVLGTPLPAATQAIYTNELNHGVARSTVARQLLTSPSGKLSQINGLYERILNRMADSAGIRTSLAILNQGKSDDRILANLLASNEYFAMFLPKSSS